MNLTDPAPLREIITYLGITCALALSVALLLPRAGTTCCSRSWLPPSASSSSPSPSRLVVVGTSSGAASVSHQLNKLGCRDRAQLVMYAYESGLAVPGHS